MFSQIVMYHMWVNSWYLSQFLSDTPEKILSLLLVSNNKIWYRRSMLKLFKQKSTHQADHKESWLRQSEYRWGVHVYLFLISIVLFNRLVDNYNVLSHSRRPLPRLWRLAFCRSLAGGVVIPYRRRRVQWLCFVSRAQCVCEKSEVWKTLCININMFSVLPESSRSIGYFSFVQLLLIIFLQLYLHIKTCICTARFFAEMHN